MRNTIFARAGNPFRNPWLNAYFSEQPWYKPLEKMDDSKLTPLDRANARVIADYDAHIGRAELTSRLDALQAQLDAGTAGPNSDVELRLLSSRLGRWVGGASVAAAARSPLEDPSLLDKMLNVKQLEKLSRRDLRLLRNTVYARRGRQFKSDLLDNYFGSMEWYHVDPTFTEDRLTAIDKKNIAIVQSVEATLGGPLTDFEQKQQDGWFGGA